LVGRQCLSPTSHPGPAFPTPGTSGPGSVLDDASQLCPTRVATHLTIRNDPREGVVDRIRAALTEARAAKRPFTASAARHSMGGQSLAKDGTVATLDQQWLEVDKTRKIYSIVTGLDAAVLSRIPDVTVILQLQGGLEIETPRYAAFTQILTDIARRGGAIIEIAGNDEIMASVTVGDGAAPVVQHGTLILRQKRDGIPGDRLLVNVRVPQLAAFLRAYPPGDPGLPHVFDY
jgi:hypothetical protein